MKMGRTTHPSLGRTLRKSWVVRNSKPHLDVLVSHAIQIVRCLTIHYILNPTILVHTMFSLRGYSAVADALSVNPSLSDCQPLLPSTQWIPLVKVVVVVAQSRLTGPAWSQIRLYRQR